MKDGLRIGEERRENYGCQAFSKIFQAFQATYI